MKPVVAGCISTAALFVVACSTTPQNLQSKTPQQTFDYTENYQEIYRRVSSQARICQAGTIAASASNEVDAQLYPDLGFGEVSSSLSNYGVRNYYWTAKIEKAGTGSRMIINSMTSLGPTTAAGRLDGWATGATGC